MKKVLATLVALSLPAIVLADNNRGFYVQGDVGHSTLKTSDEGGKTSSKGFSPRLSAGYDFGDFRVAADYTHYKTWKDHEQDSSHTLDSKIKLQSVGVSAIYDFDLNSPVKPYVGARVGLNRFSYDDDDRRENYHATETFRKTKTGLGVMTGIGYNITQNVALDAGYRYNHWGNFDGMKVHTHEVSAGVRVKF
ncbi:outer membrane beta-barrel protein [Neisseria sp. Marseille-Q1983]|uniref:opacity family porin n=1 Tax=Neisseria sp. Marseille-Q1983 TaxID=2830768 RepID=UPI001BAC3CEB|nr:outer membrane beta-barrel protein [Neisseria sp. Marseille-Q1983]